MVLAGVLMLLIKYEVLRLPFISPGPKAYKVVPAASVESSGQGTPEP